MFCFLYSCATEEGPFGAETFCPLVKKVYHVFNAQVIPLLSMSRRGNESLFYHTNLSKKDLTLDTSVRGWDLREPMAVL